VRELIHLVGRGRKWDSCKLISVSSQFYGLTLYAGLFIRLMANEGPQLEGRKAALPQQNGIERITINSHHSRQYR